jgi:hypothetical protein
MIDLFISEKVKKLKESIHHFENRIQNIRNYFDPIDFYNRQYKSIVYKLKTFSISKILYSYFRKKWNKLLFFVF